MTQSCLRSLCAITLLIASAASAQAQANPNVPFYGWTSIVADPPSPIAGETAHITVTVGNNGDAPATNVAVRLSYNDWGVTFFGWQQIGEVTIPSVPNGGTAVAEYDFVFENRAHTCLEAIIVSADENANLNDDRGQINLEVINTGETFDYWVPVVNHGDEPLEDLLLVPRCVGPDGAPGMDLCQDLRPMVIDLAPGEEFLFPIHLDIPAGADIMLVLDAFEDPLDLNNPNKHNHIALRLHGTTARDLKEDAAEMLAALAMGATGPDAAKLTAALKNLNKALAEGNWTGDNSLKKGGGPSVFAEELAATNKLLSLLGGDLPLDDKAAINEVILKLVDADRILAQTAAGGNAAALDHLADGDDHRLAGDYHAAINSYKHAWQAAAQ